jgi:hypothetical protein
MEKPSFVYRLVRFVWRRAIKRPLAVARATIRVVRNVVLSALGRSDYKRWTSPEGLEEWWEERTKAIARLVPAGSRVIEFGAGQRQLEKYLPEGCTYTPSDLVDRGPGTIVCDLNCRPLPNLLHVAPEVGVFGGVLEYIRDVPTLLQWLVRSGVKTCVASFMPLPSGLGIIGRYRELTRRRYYGYMNDLTEEDLRRNFEAVGFACTHREPWASRAAILVFCHSEKALFKRTGKPDKDFQQVKHSYLRNDEISHRCLSATSREYT